MPSDLPVGRPGFQIKPARLSSLDAKVISSPAMLKYRLVPSLATRVRLDAQQHPCSWKTAVISAIMSLHYTPPMNRMLIQTMGDRRRLRRRGTWNKQCSQKWMRLRGTYEEAATGIWTTRIAISAVFAVATELGWASCPGCTETGWVGHSKLKKGGERCKARERDGRIEEHD